jgi:WD40 repeat protein
MRSRLLHPKSFVDKVVVTTEGETSSLKLARTTTTLKTTLKTTSTAETHVTHNLEFTRDGSRLLSTTAGDDVLRVYEVPAKMIMMSSDGDEDGELLKCALKMKLPKSHYDACWYPAAQGNVRETLLTLCAAKDSGVKLFNVSPSSDDDDDGVSILSSSSREKCSYSIKNRNDELVPSISCAFTGNGGKVLGGRREEKGVCVWDTSRPGHECQVVGFDTQSKLTSCFATGNEYNGFIENSEGNIFAAGSYENGNSICVYDLRDGFNGSDCCVLSITNPHKNEKTGKMGGGVTRLKFSADGRALFSSARKSNSILCWDLRANVNGSMFTNIQRPNVRSNAKTKFDIEPCGKHLVSGGDDGILRCFDLDQNGKEVFAWKAPPKDAAVLIAAFTFHPLASSVKEFIAGKEGESKFTDIYDDENRIMNDVALGASACGERLFHPSTGRRFMNNNTINGTSDSDSSGDSSSSDSSSSSSSTSETTNRTPPPPTTTTTRKEQATNASHRNNVISIWGYAREACCY